MIKKIICILLACALLASSSALLISCEKEEEVTTKMLSFSQAQSVEEIQKMDGEQVTIIGYMSTLSPVTGKFMYLMNLPYQSCPFCVPNTTQLSNTMAVYAKDGDEFKFTDRAIQVTGTMDFGDYEDEFGYQYSYRIKDATYTILDTENMSQELKLWQQLASTDVVSKIYTMFEYVNFLCYWPTYTMQFEGGRDYLYPNDALYFLETDGAQFNYGFKSGYFDNIIATIKSVDETAFSDLVKVIEDAKALCNVAYSELKGGNYTVVAEYGKTFNDGRTQYQMLQASYLESTMDSVYRAFSAWLSSWEL
jgi:hypothetical protein